MTPIWRNSIAAYRALYAAYYERCKRANSPGDARCQPGGGAGSRASGRITFATDKTTARLAGEFYGNAINVMRGAEAIGDYIALDEQEAFDIEYWLLEEAKLQRMPAPKPMAGRIALVTGGAGGIGAATAARLLADGACVMLADRDGAAVEEVRAGFARQFGKDVVRAATCDVTDEAQVAAAFAACAREFGGLDILVANAGIASSAPIEDTTLELWNRNYDVLAQGYFLTARAAWPLLKAMKEQGGTQRGVHRLEERGRGGGRGIGLCQRQGRREPPRPLPGARRRARRDPRQRRQPRCGDQGQRRSGTATGARNAPGRTASIPARSWKSTTASARCWGATCCPRILPKRSISWRATCRPNRPAT